MERLLGAAQDALLEAQNRQTAEANRHRQPVDPRIRVGSKVLLDAKDLPITMQTYDQIAESWYIDFWVHTPL
jgi:hypothetical protein